MLDHMTFRVRDLARTRRFYSAALAALGYQEGPAFDLPDARVLGYSCAGRTDTWFVQDLGATPRPPTTGCHLAWQAATRAQVDAFHAAALAAGGTDNGAPGLRPHYHPDYYGAFVIDPDGNNVEAVCHAGSAE